MTDHDEAWDRIPQVLEDILAQDAYAEVCISIVNWVTPEPILLLPRNLVTSLLQHEQIKTTLPKARDTARLAEKVSIRLVWLVVNVLIKLP